MRAYIPRNTYLQKVEPFIGKQIIKVFTGQRRVGKSYFMYQVMDEISRRDPLCNILYIDKEKNEFDNIKDYNDLLKYIKANSKKQKNAVFIDEIQDIVDFEKALRDLHNEPDYDLYCTGSNAKMLSGELSTFLSGRYVEIEIHSLSYSEFLVFHNLSDNNESLSKYMQIGGLPNLIHLNAEKDVIFDYLQNIYPTILYKDILRRYSIRNIVFLENLIEYIADNVGSIVSAKKISEFLKSQYINIAPNTVIDYLSYLCNAFLIIKVKRLDIKGKKIFEIGEKYFFEDHGLRNSITGYGANDISKIIENLVFHHLKVLGYEIKIGVSQTKEIDFIAEKNNERVYFQVCYLLHDKKTTEREFGNLMEIKDNYPKYVISMDEFMGYNTYKGIKHIYLKDFLKMEIF